MKTTIYSSLLCALTSSVALAQGTLQYDQQSSDDEDFPLNGLRIQFYGSVGQSFTPSLSGVNFFRVKLDDVTPGNSLGATIAINLHSAAINGPVIGSSTISLLDGFAGSVDFVFPETIPVVAGATYFFEASVQSGDDWGITAMGDTYLNGTLFAGLGPAAGNDLWFREGIIVPEPSSAVLLFGGGALLCLISRKYGCSGHS